MSVQMLFEKDRFTKIRFAEMQTTVNELHKVLDDYGNETDSKKNHYNYLKMRDEANTESIEENDRRIREYTVCACINYYIVYINIFYWRMSTVVKIVIIIADESNRKYLTKEFYRRKKLESCGGYDVGDRHMI